MPHRTRRPTAPATEEDCDGRHPPAPGERAALALREAELFVAALLRSWVAALRAPAGGGRPGDRDPDWRGIARLAALPAAGTEAFHRLMSVVAGGAGRTLDVRCPACSSVSPDEEAMLQLVAALQGGDEGAARALLADWLPARSVADALPPARRFACLVAEAGLQLPAATPFRPAGATLH